MTHDPFGLILLTAIAALIMLTLYASTNAADEASDDNDRDNS